MSIKEEIHAARQKIVKDGFDMSIGELIRIYEKGELIINPAYQRSFRWDESRKTRFIESLILGIPIPPIFVFTDEEGRWELIDGLQRLSTIFQFANVLKKPNSNEKEERFSPSGTKLLPSLNDIVWEGADDTETDLPLAVRLDIERVRIRVEILKRESDNRAKFELFQRLNTGGAGLSPQEARNCVATMLNPDLFQILINMADYPAFKQTISITDRAIEEQKHVELVLRFLSFRYKAYPGGVDVHDWLNEILIDIFQDRDFDINEERAYFERTFSLVNTLLGADAFKRFNGSFGGGFSIAAFESISYGVSSHLQRLEKEEVQPLLVQRVKDMWADESFVDYTKAGTRGSTRLGKLLPYAKAWFDL
ncbi:MAG: DUF262 domain-containing protein [Rhodoferax sp.]